MLNDISEVKAQLRKECRRVLAALGDETRTRASESICAALAGWNVFQRSRSILTYIPIKGEADLTALLERHPEKCWALPRIIPEQDHRRVFHPYDAARLVRHPFGMAEPAADLPTVQPDALELALVPGLAFDRRGGRLGYGGGYFDRFLKSFAGVTVGIVFHALLLDEVPRGEHDVAMQWVATENGLLQTKRPTG